MWRRAYEHSRSPFARTQGLQRLQASARLPFSKMRPLNLLHMQGRRGGVRVARRSSGRDGTDVARRGFGYMQRWSLDGA